LLLQMSENWTDTTKPKEWRNPGHQTGEGSGREGGSRAQGRKRVS